MRESALLASRRVHRASFKVAEGRNTVTRLDSGEPATHFRLNEKVPRSAAQSMAGAIAAFARKLQ